MKQLNPGIVPIGDFRCRDQFMNIAGMANSRYPGNLAFPQYNQVSDLAQGASFTVIYFFTLQLAEE